MKTTFLVPCRQLVEQAYSNTPAFKNSLYPTDILIDNLTVTVDRLVLSCTTVSIKRLNILLSGFGTRESDTGTYDKKTGLTNHNERQCTYDFGGKKIIVLYDTYHDENQPQLLMVAMDEPDRTLIQTWTYIFANLGIEWLIHKIEIAWDFYTDRVADLKEFVKRHLWLYHNHQLSSTFIGTYYISDLRKSVKGIRVYSRPKKTNNKTHLRVELEFHRSIIRELGISWPFDVSMLPQDFRKYLNFCYIDIDQLKKAYLRANKVNREKISFEATHPIRKYPNAILRHQLENETDNILWVENLVDQMVIVKSLDLTNPIRFLKPINDLDWIFNGFGQKQGFYFD